MPVVFPASREAYRAGPDCSSQKLPVVRGKRKEKKRLGGLARDGAMKEKAVKHFTGLCFEF